MHTVLGLDLEKRPLAYWTKELNMMSDCDIIDWVDII